MGLVGSVCTRARGGVGSREREYVPKPRARVRRRVLLPGAPICCRMQQAVGCRDSGPPQKCFRPSYAHTTLKRVAI